MSESNQHEIRFEIEGLISLDAIEHPRADAHDAPGVPIEEIPIP